MSGKGCNGKIVKDMSLINRANTFDVILLKGADTVRIPKGHPPFSSDRTRQIHSSAVEN